MRSEYSGIITDAYGQTKAAGFSSGLITAHPSAWTGFNAIPVGMENYQAT